MSNSILKQITIDSLMTVIRKNTEQSPCIDRFESLLSEISSKYVVKTFISDLNKFIEEFMVLVKDVDKMETLRFKSKLLTDEFIQPERFFKQSKILTSKYITLNAALNCMFTDNNPEIVKRFDIGKRNRLDLITTKQYISAKEYARKVTYLYSVTEDNYLECQEECRKIILLWNYLPAIVKAFIQTKRRSLGLDTNSKRFHNNQTAAE